MRTLWAKTFSAIVPADQAALDFLSKTKLGKEFMAETWRPRNPRHHKLLFVLLNMVIQNSDRYPDVDSLLDALKIATGHCKVYPSIGGHENCPHCGGELPNSRTYVRPLSISWESQGQDKFNAFFDRAVHIICTKILGGANEDALRAEVERAAYGRYGT